MTHYTRMHTYTSFFSVPNTPKWRRLYLFFPLYKPRRKNPVIRGTSWQNDKAWISSTCPHSIRTHTNGSGIFDTIALLSSYFFPSGQSNNNEISRLAVLIDHREKRESLLSIHTFVPRSSVIDFTSQQSRLNMHRVPVTSNYRVQRNSKWAAGSNALKQTRHLNTGALRIQSGANR